MSIMSRSVVLPCPSEVDKTAIRVTSFSSFRAASRASALLCNPPVSVSCVIVRDLERWAPLLGGGRRGSSVDRTARVAARRDGAWYFAWPPLSKGKGDHCWSCGWPEPEPRPQGTGLTLKALFV